MVEQTHAIRVERKSKGLCISCGDPLVFRGNQCKPCWDISKAYRQKRKSTFKDLGLCLKCGKVPTTDFITCLDCRANELHYGYNIKRQVIDHFGGKCSQCSENRLPCLHLDHINNDGNKHRQELKGRITDKTGIRFYRALLRLNFCIPYKLQVLCANCHQIKHTGVQQW